MRAVPRPIIAGASRHPARPLLRPQTLLSLALALGLGGCAGLPDQRLANEALQNGDTAKAEQNYRQLAALGYADAQVGLADIQVQSGDPEQLRQAEAAYRAAAVTSPRAQVRLGRLLANKPQPSVAEQHEAEDLLKRAMANREDSSLLPLALLYLQYPRTFPEVDPQRLIDQWQAAGYPQAGLAQIMLYRAHETYDQHLDQVERICRPLLAQQDICYTELATVYQKRAAAEPRAALIAQLLTAYDQGQVAPERLDGVARVLADPALGTPDAKTAKALFERIAPGYPAAWVGLAQLLYDFPELGGAADILGYLDKGRAAALPRAELLTGRLYYEGKLVPPDPRRALGHLETASATEINAYYYIGQIYRRGYLGEPDPQKAVNNLLMAARGGQASADFALAQLYSGGRGTQPNLINAYVFIQLARQQPTPPPQVTDLAQAIEQALPLDKRAQAQQRLEGELRRRGGSSLSSIPAARQEPSL
jgi:alginate biosynthesis protein AlgK